MENSDNKNGLFTEPKAILSQEEDKNLSFLDIKFLNEKLTLIIVNIDKMNIRKSKLESLLINMRELSKEIDLAKIMEYICVCLNIAIAMNNAILNKDEMSKIRIQQIIESKMMVQSHQIPQFSEYQSKGNLMKQRYEDARKKLMKYQDQISKCYNIKISMDNEFNR